MTRRIAILDVSVVLCLSLGYVAFEALHVPKRWSCIAIGLIVVAYVVHLARRGSDSWRDLGFRTDNLRAGLFPVCLSTALLGMGLVGWAGARGRACFDPQGVAILFLLYPVWAVVQQLTFQGVLHRRLMVLVPSRVVQVTSTSGVFAAFHVGNLTLVLLTFSAGLLWSILYRRYPNLWLLGASHTVLAAVAYPVVLGDTPLSRF